MKKETENKILFLWIGVIVGLLIGLFIVRTNPDYRDGQIDAINGVIKYELVIQDDNTSGWELIKIK